jgi:hypothetical protein
MGIVQGFGWQFTVAMKPALPASMIIVATSLVRSLLIVTLLPIAMRLR